MPIVIVALILSLRYLPGNPVKRTERKFDWISGVMNALTFGLLIFSIEGFTHGVSLSILLPGIGVVLLIGYFFVRRQLSQEYPLLPVDLLRIPIFSLSVGTSVSSFVAQCWRWFPCLFLAHTLELEGGDQTGYC